VLVALGNLRELITGVRFGIVTNGEKNISWEKMRALDLVDLMEHTVISGELGITKPDRRIFEHACNLFSVAPDAAVYVGDRLQIDAVAASQAGLLGVWLNRYGNGANDYEGEHAVLTIRSLADLPALLKVKTKNTMIRS
jgi:putative hydrolase of the HAD superfamily